MRAILFRRNTEAANKMCLVLKTKSSERQAKILKTFRKDEDDE